MDVGPRVNPFRVGGPIRDPADFAGREEVVQQIACAMLNFQNVSLHGERRTGKTSILLHLAHPASGIGLPETHIPVYFSFQDLAEAGRVDVWRAMADAIAAEIEQRRPDHQAESRRFRATTTEFLASSGASALFGTGFGRALAQLNESGLKIHFLFDEFDQTDRNSSLGDAFYDALRSLPMRAENVSYVIASRTGLAALQPAYSKVSSPFFNIFTTIVLASFCEDEVQRLIFDYFARAGLDLSLAEKLCAESAFLYDVTGYHPFFLQALGYHLCAGLDKPEWPLGQVQQEALKAFETDSESHFDYYWKVSSRGERELIEKLATGQAVDWDAVGNVANSLENRCLIIPAESGWRLFSSVFTRWVRERQLAAWYEEGTVQLAAGEWERARESFEKILQIRRDYRDASQRLQQTKNKQEARILCLEGVEHLDKEDWHRAVEKLRQALQLDPGNKDAVEKLSDAQRCERIAMLCREGIGYVSTNQEQEAIQRFEQVLGAIRDPHLIRDVSFLRRWGFPLAIVLGIGLLLVFVPSVVTEARQQLDLLNLAVTQEFVGSVIGVFGVIVCVIGLLIPAERLYGLLERDKRLRTCMILVALFVIAFLLVMLTMNFVQEEPILDRDELCNGSFEDGFRCWEKGGNLNQTIQCEAGQCFAVLGDPNYSCEGDVPVGEAWIKQSFRVPQALSPTLSLRYRVFSYDLDSYDFFQVGINDKARGQYGNTEWEESDCTREVWDSGWQFLQFDLSSYSGERAELSLHNINSIDAWWNTWAYVAGVEVH